MPPLLILFFGLTVTYFIARNIKLRLKLNGIPGPAGLPILGSTLDIIRGGSEALLSTLEEFHVEYGSRFKFWLGINPYVVVSSAKDIEKVLSSHLHIDKSRDYNFFHPWLGAGLLTSKGALWHSRRKMLTPAFHFAILEDFLHIMNEQGDVLVDVLNGQRGKEFDIFPFVTRAALDIICETAMGKKIEAQRQTDSEYVKAVYRISDIIQHRQLRPWLHPDFAWSWSSHGKEEGKVLSTLHHFTDTVIRKRKKERENGQKKQAKKPAFLDLLLDFQAANPHELTDLSIREEVDTFMFEGHDTTAANLNWTIYLLGRHPQIQGKVHEELDRVLGHKPKDKITSADLSQLKYLELCIKESLRLFPSVPLIGRSLAGELKLDENTTLPQETTVLVLVFLAHRDPKVFKDPEEFRPERFQDLEKSPFSFVPFSAGPRNCIGQKFALMEEKVVLAKVLQEFKIKSLQKLEDITLMAELILRPKEGIRVLLEKRE